VALYARYGSDQQRETSIEDQLQRCRDFVIQNGGTADERMIFKDAAISGATMDRAGMHKLQSAVDASVVDAIVAEDTSRVSRDLADSTSLNKKLRYREVALFGVADGIDTTAPNAKINFAVRSLLSDVYLEELLDNCCAGVRLDFSDQGNQGIAPCWVPFTAAIAVGWG
jgi:DNA invertase Pin-like site-specific DNA recombinase